MPVLPDLGACIGFITSRRLRESIRNADVVELQWAEFFIFARLVHRLNPSATIIGYVHDVPSQRIERAVATWRGPLRRVYLRYVTAQERQLVRGLHAAIVLSQKDADLLSARGVNFDVHVLNPPLKTRSDSVTAKPGPTRTSHTQAFGFVAAFHRPENNDAGLWLLNHIWPHVVDEVPAAHLYLVGSRPSKELRDAAENIGESVEVTGYVDDIDSFYEHFDTVIIPLRYGAGVKIKTISGILAQKNVIATPIAIEGTLPDHFFYCVSDAPDVLADAMVNVARRPEGGRSIVAAALAEVGARYSIEDYSDAMLAVYDVRRCHSQVDNGAPVRWRVSNSLRITSPQVQASAASAHE
ncbi:hypothetical protein MMUC44124_29180 [Mycolicibacterium mucogenicum DSM 44124]|nr:hypothetical protein MMUC44124_29180 [Mycolicibacterium mucogenicum DSM 44124]